MLLSFQGIGMHILFVNTVTVNLQGVIYHQHNAQNIIVVFLKIDLTLSDDKVNMLMNTYTQTPDKD